MKKRTKNIDLDPENGFAEFGGYMSAKVSKLEEQFLEQQKNLPSGGKGLFSGISIFVNGWTNPSSEELKRIMMDNGGNNKSLHAIYLFNDVFYFIQVSSIIMRDHTQNLSSLQTYLMSN